MGKARKISTDKLIEIIQKYISSNPYVGKLKYSDLVSFAKEIGYSNLIYQDFSRNPKIKQLINEFNEKNTLLNANKVDSNYDFKKITINVDTIVETYANDKKTQKALLNIFKDSYSKAFDKIQTIEEENTKLKYEVVNLKKALHDITVQNRQLRNDLKDAKDTSKEEKKAKQEIRIINLVEYLIKKNCATKLDKNDIVEVMKNIYYPSNNSSDILDDSLLEDKAVSLESLFEDDIVDTNVIELNPNFFD